eukprot:TRINITY_DN15673_c0_g1_i1.p1 TRINITY_DN15673_c0_g1~~TRINITY_DN15673_c0_g1_i1.p1  ORF type:complete len:495 (-),score=110.16 TRINITY_DN15673_c0_g1_i1:42-1526(-)
MWFAFLTTLLVTANALVWPEPDSYTPNGPVSLCSSFTFVQTGAKNDLLERAFARYTNLIFGDASRTGAPGCVLKQLSVSIGSQSLDLSVTTDESYSLQIADPSAATLTAANVFGALRGLETFSQLVYGNNSTGFTIATATITDAPRFQWRGLLIDSARHYLSVSTIMKLLDTMSYSKLNVLHWHLVDAESFPLQVEGYPGLSGAGAYNATSIYTSLEIQSVVKAGLDRGIRVIPEIDMPGHSDSWGAGYPWAVADCPSYSSNINNVPLKPSAKLFQMIQAILNQLDSSFSDAYVHLGGDEVVYQCWLEDPEVVTFMKNNNLASGNDLYKYLISLIRGMATKNNKSVLYWQEVFMSGASLPSDAIVQVWKDEATLLSVAKAGVNGILSNGWYLYQTPDWDWQDFYNNEPFSSSAWTEGEKKKVLGGEVCAWGEYVNDYNFEQVLWPRTAAAAERLWSQQSVTDLTSAKSRLTDFVCLLNKRGVHVGPIGPNNCAL